MFIRQSEEQMISFFFRPHLAKKYDGIIFASKMTILPILSASKHVSVPYAF